MLRGRVVESTHGALPVSTGRSHYFVVKLDASGKQIFATGGIGGTAVALDAKGFIHVAAAADSEYPVPVTFEAKAAQSLCGSPCDHAYVAKLDPAGSHLVYVTWISGTHASGVSALWVDNGGNAILAGVTEGPNYPVTTGAFQTTSFATLPPIDNTPHGHPCMVGCQPFPYTGYVTKVNATGSGLLFSTFLGGSGLDTINSMAVDSDGNIYLAGLTGSADFPGIIVVPDACRPSYLYPVPFVTRLSAARRLSAPFTYS